MTGSLEPTDDATLEDRRRPLGALAVAHSRPPDDHLVVTPDEERHAAEVDRAGAVAARTEAVWLLRQASMLCAVAFETHARAARTMRQAESDQADAQVDELTGALRRHGGFVALQHEIDRARRECTSLVVGFLDVDALKEVNDTYGHQAGDELLICVVAALRASLRSYDVVVRYGGDEFVFSLAGADETAAAQRLKVMRTLLGMQMPGRTVSAGFSTLGEDDDLETLVRHADRDLYARRARERGRIGIGPA